MAKMKIREVEAAFIKLIEGSDMNRYLKTLKRHEGDLQRLLENLVSGRITIKTPACIIAFAGNKYNKGQHPVHLYDKGMECFFFTIDKSQLASAKQRRVSSTSPGPDAMLEDLNDAVCGKELETTTPPVKKMDPVEIVSERSVFQGKNISIYQAIYKVPMDYQSAP